MNEERLLAFAKAWSHKNIDAIMVFFVDNCAYSPSVSINNKNVFKGKNEIRNAVISLIEYDNSMSSSVQNVYINEDFGFWEWEYTTHDGKKIKGCDAFKFKDNKILEKNAFRKISL